MKLLLHMCCAPCAAAIVKKLNADETIQTEGFFYNPNIHPIEEFEKRKSQVANLSESYNLPVIIDEAYEEDFWRKTFSDKSRCLYCYYTRLDKTAEIASKQGFEAFTTTLLISPYQNHELIYEQGRRAAEKFNICFYYEDFRTLYHTGRQLSRAKGYYMQKYCGCFFSYSESHHPKKPIYFKDEL